MNIKLKKLINDIILEKDDIEKLKEGIKSSQGKILELKESIQKNQQTVDSNIAFSVEDTILKEKYRFTRETIASTVHKKLEIIKLEEIKETVKDVISSYIDDGLVKFSFKNEKEGFELS